MASRRLVTSLLVVLVALSSFGLVRPTPAVAACFGAGCNGLDPVLQGCDLDQVVVASLAVPGVGTFQRRYSRSCNAFWSVAVSPVPTQIKAWMNANFGATVVGSSPGTLAVSKMWAGGTACGTIGNTFQCV